MSIKDAIEQEAFRMHLANSLEHIATLEHNGYFRNKAKTIVLQELENMLLEEAKVADKKYYETVSNRAVATVTPALFGLCVIAIPIFSLSAREAIPVAALSLFFAGIIMFSYSFVLILSLDQPNKDAVVAKKTANLVLRVLDVYEGRADTLNPSVSNYIQQRLTLTEQEEICRKLNKAIARLQLG